MVNFALSSCQILWRRLNLKLRFILPFSWLLKSPSLIPRRLDEKTLSSLDNFCTNWLLTIHCSFSFLTLSTQTIPRYKNLQRKWVRTVVYYFLLRTPACTLNKSSRGLYLSRSLDETPRFHKKWSQIVTYQIWHYINNNNCSVFKILCSTISSAPTTSKLILELQPIAQVIKFRFHLNET